MSRYEITTFDVCAEGMERLRNQDEFILLASVHYLTPQERFLSQWLEDIQAVMREDDFDYDAAEAAVKAYWAETVPRLRWPNPFHLDSVSEPSNDDDASEEDDGVPFFTAFLFVRDLGADFAAEQARVEAGDFDASPDAHDPARPWVVTLDPPGTPVDRLIIVGRFSTVESAEAFIGNSATLDPAWVHEGFYGIDGPSEENEGEA